MDWTNSADDAAGVEHQIQLRKFLEQNPHLIQRMAAEAGAIHGLVGATSPNQERWRSNLRSEAPITYRAANYGAPLAMMGVGAAGANPYVAGAGAVGFANALDKDPGFTLADLFAANPLWGK